MSISEYIAIVLDSSNTDRDISGLTFDLGWLRDNSHYPGPASLKLVPPFVFIQIVPIAKHGQESRSVTIDFSVSMILQPIE